MFRSPAPHALPSRRFGPLNKEPGPPRAALHWRSFQERLSRNGRSDTPLGHLMHTAASRVKANCGCLRAVPRFLSPRSLNFSIPGPGSKAFSCFKLWFAHRATICQASTMPIDCTDCNPDSQFLDHAFPSRRRAKRCTFDLPDVCARLQDSVFWCHSVKPSQGNKQVPRLTGM